MLAMSIEPPKGLSQAIARLRQTKEQVPQLIEAAVKTSAFEVAAEAKRLVPHSTGRLQGSIQPYFFSDPASRSFAASIGSYLPYAARQEFDTTLDHSVRPVRTRIINTIAGKIGSIIKGTGQDNPNATWGFLRKALAKEKPNFMAKLRYIVARFAS